MISGWPYDPCKPSRLVGYENAVVEKFCYNDTETYCTTDGGLYTWPEAMSLSNICKISSCATQVSSGNHQGICPTGWHIPKAAEWNTLVSYLGGSSVAGAKIKLNNTEFSSWNDPVSNDGNSTGFSAFPSGIRYYYGGLINRGEFAHFWGATESTQSIDQKLYNAFSGYLNHGNSDLIANYDQSKGSGYSVRCLRD